MDWDDTPQSVDDWLVLARRHHNGARTLLKEKQFALSYAETGFAVECYLKAAILRKSGANRWPDKKERPDLWQHEPLGLLKALGVTYEGLGTHPIRHKLKLLLEWRRSHGYNPGAVPERYATDIYNDAFSSDGVVEWISKTFHLPC